MARVQGTVEECFPTRHGYNVWIDREGRHVAVRFARDVGSIIEGIASTWTEAILAVCEARATPRSRP
jgi:hypothetical protein